jgi:hypothetical protein
MQRWCTRRGQAHGLLSSPPSFRQMKQHSSLHISSLLRLVEVVADAGGNLTGAWEEGVTDPVTRRLMREEGVGVGIGAWTSVLPDMVA